MTPSPEPSFVEIRLVTSRGAVADIDFLYLLQFIFREMILFAASPIATLLNLLIVTEKLGALIKETFRIDRIN